MKQAALKMPANRIALVKREINDIFSLTSIIICDNMLTCYLGMICLHNEPDTQSFRVINALAEVV